MQVKVSNAAPAPAFDRPNTTADRMGTLIAAFAHHSTRRQACRRVRVRPGPDHRRAGRLQRGLRHELRRQRLVQRPEQHRPPSATASPGSQEQGGDDLQVRHPAPATASCRSRSQPKGIHDEMNSANFDEWGRMTANLGLEAPGATPLLQNIILYPYVNPATEVLDATGLPSSLNVTPISSARRRHPDLEDHPQRGGHPPDPLPPLRRAGHQPGHLGQHHHPARTDRARLEGHRAGQPARGHDRRPAPDRADAPVRRPGQHPAAQPDDADRRQGIANGPNGPRPGSTTPTPTATRSTRSPTQLVELRLGVRLPLPHPQPRGDGHDAAGHGARGPGTARRTRPVASPAAASSSTGPTAHPSTTPNPATWGNPRRPRSATASNGPRSPTASPAPYTEIATAPANTTTYTDNPPDPTITYDYRVTAFERRRRFALERDHGRRAAQGPDRTDRSGAAGADAARRRAGRAQLDQQRRPTRRASSSSAPSAPEPSACSPRWLRPTRATSTRRSCQARTATGSERRQRRWSVGLRRAGHRRPSRNRVPRRSC